jgi:hypothetical protein
VKISYVIPGPMSQGPLGPAEVARRQDILRGWAAPDVEVTVRECPQGPASIESAYEEYLSVAGLAAVLTELEEQSQADAAIVGCFGDPGLDALYEVTSSLPVVGPGEASMHFACMLGRPFGIITVADGSSVPSSGWRPRPAWLAAWPAWPWWTRRSSRSETIPGKPRRAPAPRAGHWSAGAPRSSSSGA